jgi:hypothetical protein
LPLLRSDRRVAEVQPALPPSRRAFGSVSRRCESRVRSLAVSWASRRSRISVSRRPRNRRAFAFSRRSASCRTGSKANRSASAATSSGDSWRSDAARRSISITVPGRRNVYSCTVAAAMVVLNRIPRATIGALFRAQFSLPIMCAFAASVKNRLRLYIWLPGIPTRLS